MSRRSKLQPLLLFFAVSVLLGAQPVSGWGSTGARTLVDTTGASTPLTDQPRRIVTLAPSLAELAAEILGPDLDRIVGVTERTDFPPKLAGRESVGPFYQFNVEKVVSLKPDLVLATTDGNPKDQVLRLRESGVPVITVSTDTLEQVRKSAELVGQALGDPAGGERVSRQLARGLEKFRERARGRKPVTVLLQVGTDPLVVAGKGSFLDEALVLVGGKNVYAESRSKYPKPAWEDAVNRNPDVILILAMESREGAQPALLKEWQRFPKLKAVKGGKVRVLPGDTLLRPTLRLLEGLDALEKAVHGS